METAETQELLDASEQMKTENGLLKCESHPTLYEVSLGLIALAEVM